MRALGRVDCAQAAVGAKDEARLWLDRAIERGMFNYPLLFEHDRYLDNIRGDARLGDVMGQAGREWERFEVLSSAEAVAGGHQVWFDGSAVM